MRILITGGAGYIGSILAPMLLARGDQVTVLDNFRFRQTSLLDCCRYPAFRIFRGDARDEQVLRPLVAAADAIIPLAALVGAPICRQDTVAAETTNFAAVDLVCRLASREQWVLLPTTNSGYGIGDRDKPCTEESPLRPISLYGRTKVQAEEVVLRRENSLSFRLATVFGLSPRMRLDLLVNDFVYRAVHDRAMVIFEGHFRRNFIHVRDVGRVFIHALDHFETMRGRAYNAGLEEANLTKLELCAAIKRCLPDFAYLEAPVGEDPDKRDYLVSNARLLATGFRTEWSLESGIMELIKGFTILRDAQFSNV
jgi:nucleoside-diphosphate-sugar epimerase